LVIVSEENHENLRALVGGCVHWHMKKAFIGNSEENQENSGPWMEAVFIGV
jgi:hypothetical protein